LDISEADFEEDEDDDDADGDADPIDIRHLVEDRKSRLSEPNTDNNQSSRKRQKQK